MPTELWMLVRSDVAQRAFAEVLEVGQTTN